jgi:hypothetical protein
MDDEWSDIDRLRATILDGWITEEEFAGARDVSVRTCQRDRAFRRSPPYLCLGRQIYYRIDAVREWFLQQEQTSRPAQLRHNRAELGPRGGHTAGREASCSNATRMAARSVCGSGEVRAKLPRGMTSSCRKGMKPDDDDGAVL